MGRRGGISRRLFHHRFETTSRSHRTNIVLFGGDFNVALDDTWTFQYDGGVDEVCGTRFDGDNDGAIGCADPDCWAQCKPSCAPGSTSSWPTDCSTSVSRCGDGVCNSSLENRELCPADCGAPIAACGDFVCDTGESQVACPGDCTP